MRARPRHRLKGADLLLHQVDLATERDIPRRADAFLLIEPGRERAAPPQEHVESLDQGVPAHPRVGRAGVMAPHAFHLLPFGLGQRGVVADQVPGHQGFLRTAHPAGALPALTLALGLHQRRDLRVETRPPRPSDGGALPGGACQEPTQARDARPTRDLPPQPRERAPLLAQQQPQQHGHEVLILGFAETRGEAGRPLAHTGIEAYNRDRHGGPPGCKGV